MRIETLSPPSLSAADLPAGLLPAWTDLAAGTVFRRPEWLAAWWAGYGSPEATPLLLLVRDDGAAGGTAGTPRLAGVVPFVLESTARDGRRLRLMGSGEACTDHPGLICRPDDAEAVAVAVASWLDEAARGRHGRAYRWQTLTLDCVLTGEPTLAPLTGALTALGHTVATEPGLNVWRLALPATWEEYLATLSKGHRKQLRRLERDYLAEGRCQLLDATASSVAGDAGTSFETGMAVLKDLHQRRRNVLGEPGCFADPRFERFLTEAGRAFLAVGGLNLTWMTLDGTPAAAEIHFVDRRTVSAYQAGVDPDRLDDEPGRVISIAVLKRAIAEGRQVVDFLRGDEPYKAHWRAEPHATVNVRVAADRFQAQLRHGLWQAGRQVRTWLKASRTGERTR